MTKYAKIEDGVVIDVLDNPGPGLVPIPDPPKPFADSGKRYAKISGGKVLQIQPRPATGFVEVPKGTVPGQLDNGDGTFSNPPPSGIPSVPLAQDIDKLIDLLIDVTTGTTAEKTAAVTKLQAAKTKRTALKML